MNGSETLIRTLTDNAASIFPVRKRFPMHQIIFIKSGTSPGHIWYAWKNGPAHILGSGHHPLLFIMRIICHTDAWGQLPDLASIPQIYKALSHTLSYVGNGLINLVSPVIVWSTQPHTSEIILFNTELSWQVFSPHKDRHSGSWRFSGNIWVLWEKYRNLTLLNGAALSSQGFSVGSVCFYPSFCRSIHREAGSSDVSDSAPSS